MTTGFIIRQPNLIGAAGGDARGISMSDLNAGEVGGVFAGVVTFFAAVGKGMAWLLNWQGERREAKAQRLVAWEASLDRREKEYRESIEEDLGKLRAESAAQRTEVERLRSQQAAIGFSLLEVTLELRAKVPSSPVLVRVRAALRHAFPAQMGVPPEMTELLRALDDETAPASER